MNNKNLPENSQDFVVFKIGLLFRKSTSFGRKLVGLIGFIDAQLQSC
jgi:hypothetical protein